MADHQETATAPEDVEGAQPHSRFSPLRLLWRHKGLVALGVVIGCCIGALYYARATPVYTSTTQVLVVKKSPDALQLPGPSAEARVAAPEDYLSTHQSLIHSPKIVFDAVQKANLASLKSFAGHDNPTDDIIAALKVTRETNSG